jgi:ribosomal protein S18 acetylase RimI-like enzyme
MKIRTFQPEDLEEVQKLHFLGLQQTGSDLGPGPWDDDLKNIKGVYLKNGGEFIVGLENEVIVAMGALRKLSDEAAEIKRMRVHPDFQRNGFGQIMYDHLEKFAMQLYYKKLVLDTPIKQVPAQNFYEKNGFREVSRKLE